MENKIKVLHIIKSLGRGGAEMLLPETLRVHDQQQFEFHYIYFLPWKNQMVADIERLNGKVTCFSAANNFQLLLRWEKVAEYCDENEIQLIHCHLPWAGFLGRLVRSKVELPVIYTEHNMQERYHFLTKKINKYTFNYQDVALGVSNDVTNSIIKNISPSIPVKTILNGVNTEKFSRTTSSTVRVQYNIPEDAFVIGVVAVFRFQKRLKEWLKVFSEVTSKNDHVYGLIIGAGPLEKEILEECEKLQLKKIFFPGLQTETRPYFEAMDVFMMTSSFEGLPIALLEAMSMECAIVSTDAGGIKEVINNEEDGLTCSVNDWPKLSALCQRLISNPLELQRFKVAARRKVQHEFSLEQMVEKLEVLYMNNVKN